jgi:hypothetical protein
MAASKRRWWMRANAPSSSSPSTSTEVRCPRFRPQPARVLGKERKLGQLRPARHGGEREQIDPAPGNLLQEAIRGAQLVTNVRIVVLDAADRVGHWELLHDVGGEPTAPHVMGRRRCGTDIVSPVLEATNSSSVFTAFAVRACRSIGTPVKVADRAERAATPPTGRPPTDRG